MDIFTLRIQYPSLNDAWLESALDRSPWTSDSERGQAYITGYLEAVEESQRYKEIKQLTDTPK